MPLREMGTRSRAFMRREFSREIVAEQMSLTYREMLVASRCSPGEIAL